jgi:hypothetical protein
MTVGIQAETSILLRIFTNATYYSSSTTGSLCYIPLFLTADLQSYIRKFVRPFWSSFTMPTSNDIRSTIPRHHSDFILPRLYLASYNLGVDSRTAHRSINDPISGISSSSPHSRICRLSYLICKRTNYFSFRIQLWLTTYRETWRTSYRPPYRVKKDCPDFMRSRQY